MDWRFWRRRQEFRPPKPTPGMPDIKTAQIMTLWGDLKPRPSECRLGDKVMVPMKSGKTAEYVLIDVDHSTHWASDVDWEWYVIRFVGYSEAT